MSAVFRIPAAAAALLVLAAPLSAVQPGAAAGVIHRLDHPVASRAGETIRIVNPFGDVRVRAVPDRATASLRVTVQSEHDGPVAARLDVGEHGDGPVYAVVATRPDQPPLRADVVAGLPDRAGIDVRLLHGDFAMHPAGYPVRVRAESGAIGLRTLGEVDVRVTAGRVVYDPPGDGAAAGGSIRTSGAPVDVLMRGAAPLNFRIVSGAAVTTDSPALLATRSRDGRAVSFGPGQASATLAVQTDHAPVRLVVEGHR